MQMGVKGLKTWCVQFKDFFEMYKSNKMNKSNPSKHKKWVPNVHWALVQSYIPSIGSKIWSKTSTTWKVVSKVINLKPFAFVEAIYSVKI